MKEGFVTVCICVMLCVLGVGFMLFVLELDKVTVSDKVIVVDKVTVDNSVETVDNCEHDWVITSEYSWYRGQYRTISKCSKCGKVVK